MFECGGSLHTLDDIGEVRRTAVGTMELGDGRAEVVVEGPPLEGVAYNVGLGEAMDSGNFLFPERPAVTNFGKGSRDAVVDVEVEGLFETTGGADEAVDGVVIHLAVATGEATDHGDRHGEVLAVARGGEQNGRTVHGGAVIAGLFHNDGR